MLQQCWLHLFSAWQRLLPDHKNSDFSFVFKPPTHWEYQYIFALSISNKENVIYLGFNYSMYFQKCQNRHILSLANTIFDLLLNVFCKRDSCPNLEQLVELCHILPLHYSCVLPVADDLSNTEMRESESSCLRNWVMINTEKATVIAEELLQIQLEDKRSWRPG